MKLDITDVLVELCILIRNPEEIDNCSNLHKFEEFHWETLYNKQPKLQEFIDNHKEKYLLMKEVEKDD